MPLIEEFEANGRWLFRWRSYLPLAMLGLALASLGHFTYPLGSSLLDQAWECCCLLVGGSGLLVRGLVAAYVPDRTSGRNKTQQVADSLNTTGMYSIVRHPLYLGNLLMGLAVALFLRIWWIPLIYLLSFVLYYERIVVVEEAFLRLKFGEEYMAWASHTPAFVLRLSKWKKPSLPFSLRALIRREYQSAFGLIMALFALEALTEWHMEHRWRMDVMWIWIVGLATCGYLIARFLHKKTTLLRAPGR
jgi:protein-S-isoprenylcysteine O-methyltransferase Ste14